MPETPPLVWNIQRLEARHARVAFDCGKPALNEWLRRYASQHDRRDLARTYVAVRPGESEVLGYYALSNHQVAYEALPEEQAKGLPTIDLPAVLLGRLAVDRSVQGRGLGADLLLDALRRAEYLAQHVGIWVVEVEAIDEDACRFYVTYGFVPLLDDPRHLLLPMQIVRKLGLPPL